jgi:RHH-type proline utilization regulon transcriptional repressor/proline dehydrogenase/delta 1-pyrroline-5-carboxylate dehydrogenase
MFAISADPSASASVEAHAHEIGRRLARAAGRSRSPARLAHDRMMSQLISDPHLRVALFRLVDVAPACADEGELADHLESYLTEASLDRLRWLTPLTSKAVDTSPGRQTVGRAASLAVGQIARRFIVGFSVTAAADALERMWRQGTAVTVDLLGEATVTPDEGRMYAQRCAHALASLASHASRWPARPLLEADSAGPLPRVNLSVKVTALTPLIRAEAPERGRQDASTPLLALLRQARDLDAHIHIDMESFDSRELILELLLDLLARPEFAHGPSAGLVLQAYLRDSEQTLERILGWTDTMHRAVPLTVRLVKGAYWDREMIQAAQHGWVPPVWTEKIESDRCFERLTRRLIDSYPRLRPAIASHNVRSVAHAIAYARRRGLAPQDLEIQILRGLGDDLARSVAGLGLRCRTYCPVGQMVEGMAYLVRRLLENTSNESFLHEQASGRALDELLSAP